MLARPRQQAIALIASSIALAGCVGSRSYRSFDEVEYPFAAERTIRGRRARVDLRVAELGDAADRLPILLLHPWGTSMLVWSDIAPALARDRRVLLLDLPGHGKSGKPPGAYPVARMAAAARDALEAAGVERAIVLGNSLGGATALALAERAPSAVAGLVLIGAPGGAEIPGVLVKAVEQLATARAIATLSGEALAVGWNVMLQSDSPLGSRIVDDALTLRGVPEWERFARAGRASLVAVARWQPRFDRIRAPVMVAHGGADMVVWPSSGRALAERLPSARFELFEGCGHMLEIDCKDELLAKLGPFLAEIDQQALAKALP